MSAGTLLGNPNTMWRRMLSFWQRIAHLPGRAPRRLRVAETVPLGERRFIALVEFEESRFLVGGTPSSLVLLANLGEKPSAFRSTESVRLAVEEAQR